MTNGPLLIVNADDFGLTPGVTRGIVEGFRDGVLTSTSMLAVAPAFDLASAMLSSGATDGLGVGVHFAAVGEDPPLLSAREVPTLVDRTGHFWLSWREFLPRAAAGRIDPEDLRREFAAQIERIRSIGVPLTHVDTHQHLHLWPLVQGVVLSLAAEAELSALRVTRSSARSPIGLYVRRLGARLAGTAAAAGFRQPASFAGLDEAGAMTGPVLSGAVAALARRGVASAEIGCHPGQGHDPDRVRYQWGYDWAGELAGLCSSAVREEIARHGFQLGTFADL